MLRPNVTRSFIAGGHGKARLKGTITDLQAAFRDPNSPFYIPPGTTGPASPDEIPGSSTLTTLNNASDKLENSYQKLLKNGFDPTSFWEQRIAWGDQDSFQHVNNVRYVRFFESSRVKWMTSLGEELGGPPKGQDMMKGRGVSLILKSIAVQFRRPVTYPDTLIIGYQPNISSEDAEDDPTTLSVTAKAYSLRQQAFVATSNEVLVWYDYDKLKKCDPGDRIRDIVRNRIRAFV
ncbi:hypothetical protein AX14_014304 [Amanita brunnescens Koide BX004]|nr:hypothetical protein AX14_014304 [Amanita brunnescens Koide BX004]